MWAKERGDSPTPTKTRRKAKAQAGDWNNGKLPDLSCTSVSIEAERGGKVVRIPGETEVEIGRCGWKEKVRS